MCPPVSIQIPISHDYTPDTQKVIICLFICLEASHQLSSFKLRAQSCLNCPSSLVKSQRFQKLWGKLHACGPGTLRNYLCASMRKEYPWLKAIAYHVPSILYVFLSKITLSIPWLFKCHYYSSHSKFLTFWMNSLLVCPKWEGTCQEDASASDRGHGRT